MKYLEFTFRTSPCTEVVNDVLSAILGDEVLRVLLNKKAVLLPIYKKICMMKEL